MQTLLYEYNEKQIEFILSGDIMVNATEMAAIYGRKVSKFLENKETQDFINELKKTPIGENNGPEFGAFLAQFGDLDPKKVVKCPNGTPILITIQGREGATWMHRWLAIDFAMWLDVRFKTWIIRKIDHLLINFSNKQRELLSHKHELIRKKNELITRNLNNPDVMELNQINDELRGISQKLGQTTKSQYSIWNNLGS